jgi:hypothetical protein
MHDAIRLWRVNCPPWARELGLAKEHVAIAHRHNRVRAAWAPHLEASRQLMLEMAARCPARKRVLVIGAGDCLDVPVAGLAGLFEKVTLADIAVGTEARRLAKQFPARVECVNWDASGALAALAKVREQLSPADAPAFFTHADPGSPPGGEADLVISANCISQLGLVPGHSLPATEQDSTLPERCARAAARRHLDWLAQRSGIRLLIADAARLDIGPDGKQLKRETLYERFGLARPDRQWRWNLAPIPEWSDKFHRVHEVGAWIYG